jgi:hypothetical protein
MYNPGRLVSGGGLSTYERTYIVQYLIYGLADSTPHPSLPTQLLGGVLSLQVRLDRGRYPAYRLPAERQPECGVQSQLGFAPRPVTSRHVTADSVDSRREVNQTAGTAELSRLAARPTSHPIPDPASSSSSITTTA